MSLMTQASLVAMKIDYLDYNMYYCVIHEIFFWLLKYLLFEANQQITGFKLNLYMLKLTYLQSAKSSLEFIIASSAI